MPSFRSFLLVLALLAFAVCPAVAVAHDHPGQADAEVSQDDSAGDTEASDYVDDSGYDDESYDDESYSDEDYSDEGYSDEDDAEDDGECVAFLEDPEEDGYDTCDDQGADAGDVPGIDAPELTPPTPSIPRPVMPKFVHLRANGQVWASPKLPRVVRRVINAANRIATRPYKYGGGHGSFISRGYDCSGSVSFALHGAGLLNTTLTSGGLAHWGAKGKGRWITIYANADHTYMVIAGMRFDTGARPRSGTRWDLWQRPARGFAVRHPAGL